MILCIYLIIVVLTCQYYNKRKYAEFIVLAFAIGTNVFRILPNPAPLKSDDLFSLILLFCFIRERKIFSNDIIGKILLIILLYEFTIGCISVITGVETLAYSIMVLRFELFYFIYFIFKKIPFKFVSKSFKILYIITIITGILYYLQFFGITGILQTNAEIDGNGFYNRINNKPLLTSVMFFYTIFYRGKVKFRWIMALFFSGMIILSQNRGEIVAVLIAVIVAILFFGYKDLVKKLIIPSIIFSIIFLPIIIFRFSSEGSVGAGASSEIFTSMDILTNKSSLDFGSSHDVINNEGTAVYRALVAKERIDYLSRSISYLLFGIGTVHEYSKKGRSLDFYYGNINRDEISYIDTTDIAFLSHVIRYGLIYLILYSIFIYISFKYLWKHRQNELILCCLLTLICKIIQIPTGDYFSGINNMLFILLILSQITNKSSQKCK